VSSDPVVAALDVGGTNIRGGLIDSTGQVLYEQLVPTGSEDPGDPGFRQGEALARTLVSRGGDSLVGLGVGMPEVVDLDGRLRTRDVIDWDRQPADQLAGLAPSLVVESDVRAGALGEAWFGAGAGLDDFVYMSVGTGLSYSHAVSRQVRAGATGGAIWMGALPVAAGLPGADVAGMDLEQYSSGRAISDRYALATGKRLRTTGVFDAAVAGDSLAEEVVATAGRALGAGIAYMVLLVDPGAVIVGGGMAGASGDYWDEAMTELRRGLAGRRSGPLPVYQAGLGERSGLVGAACAVLEGFQSPPISEKPSPIWFEG